MHGGEGGSGDLRFSRVVRWDVGLESPAWGVWVHGRGFVTNGCFILDFPEARLGVTDNLSSGFRPCRLPDGGHYRILGLIRDRLRMGIRIWVGGWSPRSLDDTPPSDDVIRPIAQVHLLGSETGPLNYWRGCLACGDALSAAFGRLLNKRRLRFLPQDTDTAVRCVGPLQPRH